MDWVDKPKNYKGLYGTLQLLLGAHLDNFPQKTLKLGTFIPGRLGTSLAACRDNNKHGGCVTRIVNANSSRGIDQVLSFAL